MILPCNNRPTAEPMLGSTFEASNPSSGLLADAGQVQRRLRNIGWACHRLRPSKRLRASRHWTSEPNPIQVSERFAVLNEGSCGIEAKALRCVTSPTFGRSDIHNRPCERADTNESFCGRGIHTIGLFFQCSAPPLRIRSALTAALHEVLRDPTCIPPPRSRA